VLVFTTVEELIAWMEVLEALGNGGLY